MLSSKQTTSPSRKTCTVKLFGYGTVDDYYELKDKVWVLNEVQLEKLRMLSIVSVVKRQMEDARGVNSDVKMASDSKTAPIQRKSRRANKNKNEVLSIPYSGLASKPYLPTDDTRKLEDLLILCIYSDLLSSKLDHCSKCLVVEPNIALSRDSDDTTSKNIEICGSILSRDPNLSSSNTSNNPQLSKMITQLETFLSHSSSLLSTLEKSTQTNIALKKCDAAQWKEVNRLLCEGNSNAKFGALERAEVENAERDRREVKRIKMQVAMKQRFS